MTPAKQAVQAAIKAALERCEAELRYQVNEDLEMWKTIQFALSHLSACPDGLEKLQEFINQREKETKND